MQPLSFVMAILVILNIINFTPMKIGNIILISFFLLFCFTSRATSPLKIYCTGPDTAGIIKGKDNVCFGTIETYTVPSIAFATGYSWKLPSGASIVSGTNTNSITVLFKGISGNITVAGTNSCSTGVASSFFVTVNPIPKATIIIDNPSGCVPHVANFNSKIINEVDSSKATFLWKFGEPVDATNQNESHVYNNAGSYNVNLKITSEFGCDTTFGPISINAYPIPKADFISSPNNTALASFPFFKFKDKSTTPELILKSKIVKYEWDFGDLNLDKDTSSKRNPEYSYSEDTGTYYVRLIIETNHGCRDTITKSVVVIPDMPFAYVLYPNPNKGLFNVEINTPGNYFFKLSSIDGKLIYERSMAGYEKEIVNQKLSKGTYMISIEDTTGNLVNQKMIVD